MKRPEPSPTKPSIKQSTSPNTPKMETLRKTSFSTSSPAALQQPTKRDDNVKRIPRAGNNNTSPSLPNLSTPPVAIATSSRSKTPPSERSKTPPPRSYAESNKISPAATTVSSPAILRSTLAKDYDVPKRPTGLERDSSFDMLTDPTIDFPYPREPETERIPTLNNNYSVNDSNGPLPLPSLSSTVPASRQVEYASSSIRLSNSAPPRRNNYENDSYIVDKSLDNEEKPLAPRSPSPFRNNNLIQSRISPTLHPKVPKEPHEGNNKIYKN